MNKRYTKKGLRLGARFLQVMFLVLGCSVSTFAQLSNVAVTGFNSDQVANGIGAPTTSTTATADLGVDNGGYSFIDATYQFNATCALPTANVLPANGLINSTAAAGLVYQLQSYSALNTLRVPATGVAPGSGKLFFTTPQSAATLYLLSVSGGGAITSGINVTVKFTDSTSQVFSAQTAQDWCNTTSSGNYTKITTTQYNRIQSTTTTGCGNFGTCQYFAEMALNIDGANYNKLIAYVMVEKTTSTNVMNVYAVGAKAPCAEPIAQPTLLNQTAATTSSISASFTDASTVPSGYVAVRYPQGATTITAPVNGITYTVGQQLGGGVVVSSGVATSFTTAGLFGGTSYDFYVYSYNTGSTCGGPVYLTSSPLTATLGTNACAGSISGIVPIGPFGTYPNITIALNTINANGIAGATTLELQSNYDPTSETYPIVFPNNPCINASKPIVIRPASGISTPITLTSASTTATIDLNAATYITFDGRPGGFGSSKMLSIVNTSTAGVAIRFVNDASYNTITFCDVQGQNTSNTATGLSGVIYFGSANATLLNGNDNNTISYSDIHATSGGFPAIGICSYGNNINAPTLAWNENNTIDHCNIYDFFSATLASTAVKLDGGSHAFTISNNRVYQTATRNFTTGNQHRAFWVSPTATGACGFQILNNYIGAADSLGTGVWTLTGSNTTNFWGMDINHAGNIPTSVQGNTITQISVTSTTTTGSDLFRGISTGNIGHVYIGTISGNTIGSSTTPASITLVTSGAGSISYGIKCSSNNNSTDTVRVQNNTISGIQVSSSTATSGANLFGIGVTTGSFTYIENNTIGSANFANSLYSSNSATSLQSVYGISVAAGLNTTVVNNTIYNLTNNYVGTSTGLLRGITVTTSTNSAVTGNVVKNLASFSTNTGTTTSSALIGIQVSPANPSTVSGNIVDSLVLANATSTAAIIVDGIYVSLNGATPTHLVTKNRVARLLVTNTSNTNAILNGIEIAGGSNIIANNMIQLGIKADGTSFETALVMRGLYLNATAAMNIYHNSVYIGGANVGTTAKNTVAFLRNVSSGTHDVRNNIFVNQRSNATTGGKHYQIYLTTATTGLTLSNNIYYGVGTGNVMGFNGTADVATLSSGWLGNDLASAAADPLFINPNGGTLSSASPANLHINTTTSTPVEAAGTLITSITDDIDGDVRSSNSPVDIGADAGNFVPLGMTIDSTVLSQVTASSLIGSLNQEVVAVKIYAKGSVNPLTLTALKLNTAGSSNPTGDIAAAKIYYTGPSTTFSTTTPYGATVNNPNGTFYVNGTQVLSAGLNCFWVVYDTKSTGNANNLLDARLDSVGLTGAASANILNGDPFGARTLAAPLSGSYNVGVGQTYPTITSALNDLKILGVGGPVTFLLKDANYSTAETFPITINAFAGASSTNTVTIMPDNGVTSVIMANIANSIVRLDGVKYFVFDGRQAGTGTTRSLTITNDNTGGSALTFINDASENVIRYTTLRGASTNTVIGVVNFATGVVTGNDNNIIEYCGIGDATTLPTTLIQARGSFDAISKFNTGNIIRYNDMFNFWNSTGESNAFKISKANASWIVKGNSIYQTTGRTFANIHYSFNWNRVVDDATNASDAAAAASLSNMIVEDNYFGGSAPQCGGTAWTETASAGAFCSYFNMGDSALSFVRRNTFANFNIANTNTGTGVPGAWNAIQYIGGKLHIDTNVIGSETDPNSIYISGASGNIVYPIAITSGTAGNYRINGNKIGGIRATGNGTTPFNIYSIFLSGASSTVTYDIEYNTIGATDIRVLASTSTVAQSNIGINTTSSANLNLRYNAIRNLYNTQLTTGAGQVIGIKSTSGVNQIIGDTIDNLTHNTSQISTGASAAVIGISLTSSTGNSVVDKNLIQRLSLTNPLTSSVATGIYYAGGTGDVISRNLIHTFSSSSSPAALVRNGIQFNGGTSRLQNNMIRLGIDALGSPLSDTSSMNGILISGGNARVFFNTVYIGGTLTSSVANTYALNRTSTGTDSIYNNILANERTGGTGNHFAIGINSNTNLKSNYNLFYNPSGASLGQFNNTVQALIANWKLTANLDGNSNSGNPSFINATGDISSFNLHISTTIPTPIEGSGLLIAGINNDFDGDVRSANSPTDIGADAGSFVLSDIFAPSISYTEISRDTVATVLTLNAFATINDVSGVDISTNSPRLYYKKSTDNNFFGGNTSFDNGWKYVVATNSTSPFSFNIDYTIINGGSVQIGDQIQYFVVAQDLLGNVGAMPSPGFSGFSVGTVLSAPNNPSSYTIRNTPLNGAYLVGAGQTAPNFTTITSAINTLNDVGVRGQVTFNLTDALYTVGTGETFPITIGTVAGTSAASNVIIKPATAVNATVAANSSAIFKLNGADYITIDGSNNGTTSRNLTLIDSNTTSAIIWLASNGVGAGATNNVIKNTELFGGSTTATTTFGIFSAGQTIGNTASGADNDSMVVVNNRIRNVGYGVYANGLSTSKHDYIRVLDNTIGELASGNSVGNIGTYILQSNDVIVERDSILNIASSNAGASPIGSDGPLGIDLEAGVTNAFVRNNIVNGVVYTGASGYGGKGIEIRTGVTNSNIEVSNNMVYNISGDGWNALDGDGIVGLRVGGATSNVRVYFNTVVLNATTSGGTSGNKSAAMYASGSVSALDVRNNIFINSIFNSTNTSSAYAIASDITNPANITVNFNNYYVSGTQGVLGNLSGTDVTTLAAWRTSTTQDQGSSNILVAFVSANNVHLDPSMYGNMSLKGTAITGITTDIDAQTRFTFPYMGADEIPTHPLPVTLVSFKALNNNGNVDLNWLTASETNNKGFILERSLDGNKFSTVTFIKGAVNSSVRLAYNYTDAKAFAVNGVNTLYYRLCQVDLNGAKTYSNVAIVTNSTQAETDVVLYPNPFVKNATVALTNTSDLNSVTIDVFDISGRKLISKEQSVNQGLNVFTLAELDLLNSGVYFIQVSATNYSKLIKVAKTN